MKRAASTAHTDVPDTPTFHPRLEHQLRALGLADPRKAVPAETFLRFLEDLSRVYEKVDASRRLQKRLATEFDRLDSALRCLGDGLCILDPEGRLLHLNPEGERLLGWTEDELCGRRVFKDLGSGIARRGKRPFTELRKGRAYRNEDARFIRKDGTSFSASYVLNPVVREGAFEGAVLVFRDVSRLKQTEEELRKARAAAEGANRAKGEFLANMSHEIRTPMNGVLGFVDLLLETHLTREQREYLDTVRVSAEALLTLINDILDFSKIEAGKFAIEISDFELRKLVENVGDLLGPRAQVKGLEFVCSVRPAGSWHVRGDPTRLRQVLVNLVGNAVKFTERGEVALLLEMRETEGSTLEAHCTVRDTGIGIPKDQRGQLFQPFSQADGSDTRRFGGTGLGLSITKHLAERMGGRIDFESEPGVGTTFTVVLPFERSSAARRVPRPARSGFEGMRMLVVEDSATNRSVVLDLLADLGCEAKGVSNADEAIVILQTAAAEGRPFDVALLDLQMPGVDGLDLAEAILSEASFGTTILVLMSPVRYAGSAPARERGFAAVLTKPVKPSNLLAAIVDALSTAGLRRQEARDAASAGAARERPAVAVRRARVLLVEDDPVNQRVALALLSHAGLEAESALDGIAAIEATSKKNYDLILMDVQMPRLDGYGATRSIRASEAKTKRRTPIVAMTARAMKGDRERCLEAGMDDYLTKPLRAEALREVVDRWTGHRSEPAGSASPAVEAEFPEIVERFRELGMLDDAEIVAETTRLFLDSAGEVLGRLAEATGRADGKAAEALAHRLRGAALAFGAGRLGEDAAKIEEAMSRAELTGAAEGIASLRAEFERVRAFAARFAPKAAT